MEQRASNPPGTLRRLDPRRDLDAVANLVEVAFGLRGDPDGQFVLNQMRENAARQRQEPFLSNLALPSADGYVWEDGGKIVGNISLIPFQAGLRPICLVANVAVAEEYRNHGIATALTRHALRIARQRQGMAVWLQVRHENQVAIGVYESLGFRHFGSVSQYRRAGETPRGTSPLAGYPSLVEVGERQRSEWPAQKAALRATYPPETRWYLNVDFNAFGPRAWYNPLNWINLPRLKHLSFRSGSRWQGTLTWQGTDTRADNLWLAMAKDAVQEEHVSRLLKVFMERIWNGRPLNLEYPMGRYTEGILSAGFELARNLDWMHYLPPQKWPLGVLRKTGTAR